MSSRVIFIPIERLEQRYTGMMYDLLAPLCDIVVHPDRMFGHEIKRGQFLDVFDTINFKAGQIAEVAKMFDRSEIQNGDVFLIGDIFFPGIESIRYMAELSGIHVGMAAFNHAGRSDEKDFVQKLGPWSDHSEKGWHDCMDVIFVGSAFHARRVASYFKLHSSRVINTGMPWDANWCDTIYLDIQPIPETPHRSGVIWPHRLCEEKGVYDLLNFAATTDKKILVTSSGKEDELWSAQLKAYPNITYRFGLTKSEYYECLAESEWYLSTAYQETFGYTLQEAIHFGCRILVPNRACYPEFVPMSNLYGTHQDIDNRLNEVSAVNHLDYGARPNADEIISICKNLF